MQQITNIGTNPSQTFTIPVGDGTEVTLVLAYRPQQIGWYFNLSWNGVTPAFQLNGRRIVASPNILRHFRNVLSFGIACSTLNNVEPLNQTDFATGVATLYLLDQAEVAQIEATAFPGNK